MWEDDNEGFVACFLVKKGKQLIFNLKKLVTVVSSNLLSLAIGERWFKDWTRAERLFGGGNLGCYSCYRGKLNASIQLG